VTSDYQASGVARSRGSSDEGDSDFFIRSSSGSG
jgi:hypothetical protein